MGLFSKLFKPSTAKTFETASGCFTLIYSKGSRNTWSNQRADVLITLGGSPLEPDPTQLLFCSTINQTIAKMNDQLTVYLSNQLNEAGLEHDFSEWQQRFKMIALEVTGEQGENIYWNITLEDQRAPYAHFVLFAEEQTIIDFSMDT